MEFLSLNFQQMSNILGETMELPSMFLCELGLNLIRFI
jgi:hypothetical protein